MGSLLKAEVIAAQVLIGRGNMTAANRLLRAVVAQLDLLVRLRVVTAADVAPLRAVVVTRPSAEVGCQAPFPAKRGLSGV